jgi:hypothetical protein
MLNRLPGFLRLAILGVVFFVGGLLLAAYWISEGHGASLATFARIRPGMSGKDVLRVLGRRSTINRRGDGSQSWLYTRATFCQVKVYLSRDGVVEETDHDH